MAHDQSEKGVILSKLPYSDSDEVVTVLLEESGVKRLFVRGSRKSKKRFAGKIDHFRHFSFLFHNKTEGLGLLKAVEDIQEPISEHQKDLLSFAFLNYLSELICEFYLENMEAKEVYLLWQDLMHDLQKSPLSIWQLAFYTLKTIEFAGYHFHPLAKRSVSFRELKSVEANFYLKELLAGNQVKRTKEILLYPQKLLEKPLKSLGFLLNVFPN